MVVGRVQVLVDLEQGIVAGWVWLVDWVRAELGFRVVPAEVMDVGGVFGN